MSYDDTQEPVLTTDDFPVAPAGNAKIQAQGQLPNGFDLDGFTAPSPSGEPWTQELLAQTAFRFTPLYIPNLTPVFNTDGGLNAAALVVNERGVLCILKTWLEQAEFDFIRLEVNDVMVDQHTVSKDEADNGLDIVLFIESSRLIDQANNKIQAFVTNLAGTTDSTKAFNIFVDAQPPVGRDPIVSTPYNENMARVRFADPTIEAFGIITDENAIAGVRMLIEPYPLDKSVPAVHHIKESDVIHLSIGGVIIKHTVSASEATGSSPISIWAYHVTWATVGKGEFVIEYFIVDRVGNHSPGFSPPRIAESQVGGGATLLPGAIIQESDYDDENDADFIDLEDFDGDASIEVPIRTYGYLAGDEIVLTVKGLSADGVNVSTTITRPVTQPNALRQVLPLERAFIEALTGGRILITYVRRRAGVPDLPSRSTLYNIKGEPVGNRLPPPVVQGIVDGSLPVPTNPVRILVRKFLGQVGNERVDLVIVGYGVTGTPSYATYTEMAGNGDTEFLLDWAFFANLVGGYFTAHYVINGGTGRPPSESTTVQVGAPAETLPAPTTLQAVFPEYTFDPGTHMGNLNVRIAPHPQIVLGSTVTLYADGTQPGGSFTSPPFLVDENWVGNTLPITVPRVNVLANLNHTLKLYYKVQLPTPGSTPLTSMPLTISVGMKLVLNPPTVVEATQVSPTLARLNPLHTPNEVTIRVTYDPMLASDSVKLHINGMPGVGSPDIAAKPGVPEPGEKYISFSVPSAFVGAYLGKSAEVSFEVIRDNNHNPSERLTLDVESFSEQTLDLVSIPEAQGGVIDTSKAANVRIEAWPFFDRNQPVFIDLEGPPDFPLREGTVVSVAEFSTKRTLDLIPKDYLLKLPNNSLMKVNAKVSLDGTVNKETAIALTPVSYSIQKKSEIIKHIPIGAGPHTLLLTPDGKKAYVLNLTSNSTTVIDLVNNVVKTSLTTNKCWGIGLTEDGTRLYTSLFGSWTTPPNYVYVWNTATDGYMGTVYLHSRNPQPLTITHGPNAAGYVGTAYWNGGQYIYEMVRINIQSNVVSAAFSSHYRFGNFFNSPDNIIYIHDEGQTIRRFDTQSNSFIQPAPFNLPVTDIVFSKTSAQGYYASVTRVGSFDRQLNLRIDERSGFSSVSSIAPHPLLDRIYVTDTATNQVHILDTSTSKLEPVGVIEGFNGPTALQVSPDGEYLYVVSTTASVLTVVKL